MSTILKALRRLEEEKASAESGRPLREQIAATAPLPPESSGRGWVAAVLALLLSAVAGGGVIWWMFGDQKTAEVEQVAAAPVAEVPAPTVPRATTRAAPAAPKPAPTVGPPEDAFASDVDVVRRPQRAPRLADTDPVRPQPEPKAGARRPVEDSAAMARANAQAQAELDQLAKMDRLIAEAAEEPTRPAAVREPDAQPTPQPTRREPAPVVAKTEPAPKPAPAVSKPQPAPVASKPQPEPAVVASAPEPKPAPRPTPEPAAEPAPPASPLAGLLVERTTWHPLADRRSAWLRVGDAAAPQEVVEGDVVDGAIVAEIQPSGVVFERDGESTRRGVGEK